MSIQIKSIDGRVLYTAEHAQDVCRAVEEAVRASADLRSADLGYADLRSANLRSANLGSADLGSANLGYADLGSADLRSANLGYADLRSANLRSANLGYADLGSANLGYADLGYADLRSANLGSADLRYADLRSANLGSANLRSAEGYNPTHVNDLLLLLDQPGRVRAYKLVTADGHGPFNGGLQYEVGKTVSVKDADTDPNVQCAAGINVATLPWCVREWCLGYRILVVEFAAKDIAAIPVGDGKFRVHKCKVVGEKDLTELGLTK